MANQPRLGMILILARKCSCPRLKNYSRRKQRAQAMSSGLGDIEAAWPGPPQLRAADDVAQLLPRNPWVKKFGSSYYRAPRSAEVSSSERTWTTLSLLYPPPNHSPSPRTLWSKTSRCLIQRRQSTRLSSGAIRTTDTILVSPRPLSRTCRTISTLHSTPTMLAAL